MDCKIVISQPMYFPWVGMLEQIRLSDIFVYYNDVQFSKGSFFNRVQIKTQEGIRWLSVPLHDLHLGQRIDEVKIDNRQDWKSRHIDLLSRAYRSAPFRNEMLEIVEGVFNQCSETVKDVAKASISALASYFGLDKRKKFIDSETLEIYGRGCQRVLSIVKKLKGQVYITGHGAVKYLDHGLFEKEYLSDLN